MAEPELLEIENEIECPADKFYDLIKNNLIQLPEIFPEIYKSVEVLEGDGKSVGTVRLWKYTLGTGDDEVLVAKETIKAIDDENKTITISAFEGHVMDLYKSFDAIVQVIPKGGGSLVKWSIKFEKEHEDHPHPHPYLDVVANVTKKFNSHFHKP